MEKLIDISSYPVVNVLDLLLQEYNYFMDAMYEVADKLELIHPARFLYNAGSTLKSWNNKMLNDGNFKVLNYEVNSKNVFSNTDIKGGVVLSYDTCIPFCM